MIDDVARKHFPACMRNLYERLKRDHHMKHFGRLQLGLFLKVGVAVRAPLTTRESVYRWKKRSYSGERCTVQACPTTSSTKSTSTIFDTVTDRRAEEQTTPHRGTRGSLLYRTTTDYTAVNRSSRKTSLERKTRMDAHIVISRLRTLRRSSRRHTTLTGNHPI